MKITLRARWFLTVGNKSWRAAVWELHGRGVSEKEEIPARVLRYRYRMLHRV
jgi:hypothetical protein